MNKRKQQTRFFWIYRATTSKYYWSVAEKRDKDELSLTRWTLLRQCAI